MQHERDPLDGFQRVQDHEQRTAHRVGQQRLVLRTAFLRGVRDPVEELLLLHVLPTRPAGAQHVEADAGHHGPQPAGQVVHLVRVDPAEAEPGLLDGVVCLVQRAEHPVGDRAQQAALLLEEFRQGLVLVHRSPFAVLVRHPS